MEEILASIRRIISEEGGGERDSKGEAEQPAPEAQGDDDILDLTEVIADAGAADPASETEAGASDRLAAADIAEAEQEAGAEPEFLTVPEAEADDGEDDFPARFVVEPDVAPELERDAASEGESAEGADTASAAAAEPEPEAVSEPEPEPQPEASYEPEAEPLATVEIAAAAPPEAMPDDGAPTAEEVQEHLPQHQPPPPPDPAPASQDLDMHQVIQRAAESAVAASGASNLGFGVTEQHIEKVVREVLKPRLRDWLDKNLAGLVERLVREEIQRLVEQSERPK